VRFASWNWGGRLHAGTVSADGRELTPLAVADAARGTLGIIEALARGEPLPAAAGARLPTQAVTLNAPLPRPLRGLWCVGRNYRAHAAELATTVFRDVLPRMRTDADPVGRPTDQGGREASDGRAPPQDDGWPIVFTKAGECVIGPHDAVRLPGPAVSSQIDYEAELAVVIGRAGRDIRRARAMDHVFGYTIVNDVTARDVQVRHLQWDLGKSFDTFCPMGPWIVSADEIDGRDLRVRAWVTPHGGETELRQDGHTRDLIFDIPTLIETCSRGITLHPGDVIATGTPAGVGMGFKPPRWLGAGDVVRIEIDGIGSIENRFELD
jgi:2-keto-4-pentenoate hydratase/2-oxohepta-3-ene-1,7-dioic acid hydratase in catechol pathway